MSNNKDTAFSPTAYAGNPIHHGIRAVFSKATKGSMTIEAALALPVFLIAMLSILYTFNIINTQAVVYQALHEFGNAKVHSAYLWREKHEDDATVSITWPAPVVPYLLWQNYGIELLAGSVHYHGHAWVGYKVDGEAGEENPDEETVYIAETSKRYHKRDCRHINISPYGVPADLIGEKRNKEGGKYYACLVCRPSSGLRTLFITDDGERYHGDVNCSSLKRTVSAIAKKEALERGLTACGTCGG